MSEIKEIIANNIVDLRKAKKWTQAEFASKLNYTDKAISKWERCESTPDVETLYQMAKLFNVTVDFFFENHEEINEEIFKEPKFVTNKKIAKLSLANAAVWFIGTVIYVYNMIKGNPSNGLWMAFIWPIPACCLLTTLYVRFLKLNNKILPYALSIGLWSLLVSLHLQFLVIGENIWLIYLIGIPLQIIIIISYWINEKFS